MTDTRPICPDPKNEVVLSYAAGTKEREELEMALDQLSSEVKSLPLYINGDWVESKASDELRCPHDRGKVLAKLHQVDEALVHKSIDAALEARKSWASLPWEQRASVFLKAAELLAGPYRALMNAATMLGQSKTIHQAEIDAACELVDFLRFNVHYMEKLMKEQPVSSPGVWNRTELRGLEGFVYAIGPFNFSSIAVNLAVAPALMGCSVLWKPAPTSMLAAWVGMKILEQAGLPKGVINMVHGDPVLISGVALKHPELSGIHFTGSTRTFQHLWKEVAGNIENYRSYPRLVGETGGKDFVFAHNSAPVDQLAVALLRGAFEYQGQKCSAASRAYIPRSIWPELKEKLLALVSELKVGDVRDYRNFMGAVIDEKAFARIRGYIDTAKESSEATIIAGGTYDDSKGYFIQPTVIEVTNPKFVTMCEEIFGPVLSIFVYEDEKLDETLKLCDETSPYALTGAIFAKDRGVIEYMNQALVNTAGNFYINDKPTGAVVGQQPFGGGRASGTNDKAGSIINLLRWTSMRTIKENLIAPTDYRYPYMD